MLADVEAGACDGIVQDSGWMGESARGWYLLPSSPVQENGTNVSPWMEQRGATGLPIRNADGHFSLSELYSGSRQS